MTISNKLSKPGRSLLALSLLCSLSAVACTDDGGEDDDIGEDESDTSSSTETGGEDTAETDTAETDTAETDTDTGEGGKPELGATPNVQCEAALAQLEIIAMENLSGAPDPELIAAAYIDTGLQAAVQEAGVISGRIEDGVLIDDAAILASIDLALDVGEPSDMIDVEWGVYLALHKFIRSEIAAIADVLPDPANDPALLYARWDATWCYYDGALRQMAQAADAYGLEGDSIEADLDAAYLWGHSGIEGEESWAVDEWVVGPAKQQIEKTTFAMVHRLILGWAEEAADSDDLLAQRRAYAAFQLIEDRLSGKNTPGIAWIEDALTGPPGDVDVDELTRQLNIAFVKRTRKYTDLALPDVGALMGTSEGFKGATEGSTYSKLVEPFMVQDLEGFDLPAYRASWATWIEAIANDDVPAAETASADLVDWNCQYQAALGIAECTSSVDEE